MIPRAFSEGKISLLHGAPRTTITTAMVFDENCKLLKSIVFKSLIKNKYPFTYRGVTEFCKDVKEGSVDKNNWKTIKNGKSFNEI